MRKIIAAAASTALCLMSIAPAYAQANHSPAFDAPRGAAATMNLRVPFGARGKKAKPTYGLSLTYGRTMATSALDGKTFTRATTLADLRFDGEGLNRAKVASFDLANLDEDKRLNLTGGSNTLLWVAIAAGAGVAAYLLFIEDDDDEDEDAE
jgi:hypothetical protein